MCGEGSEVYLLSDQPGLHFNNLITIHKSMKETTITNYVCHPLSPGVLSLGSGVLVLSVLSLVMDDDQAGGPGPVTLLVTIAVRKLGLSIITDH